MKSRKPARNSWILKNQKTVLHTPIFEVKIQKRQSADGNKKHDFHVLRCRDWCNIIPVTEAGKIVFVRQLRVGTDEFTLEVPGGVIDADDAAPQDSAIRELLEETGYAPMPGAVIHSLGSVEPNPAIQNNLCHCFAVGPVHKIRGQKLDPGEMIDTVQIPLERIPELIRRGSIRHALMLNTFLMLALRSARARAGLIAELRTLRGMRGLRAVGGTLRRRKPAKKRQHEP